MLVGGASRRFGSDKALAQLAGRSLVVRALDTLREAGVDRLVYVGGDPRSNITADVRHVPDRRDGERCALRGVLTALEFARGAEFGTECPTHVVIIGCDLPMLKADSIRRMITEMGDHDASVAFGERDHWSCLAARPTIVTQLCDSFSRGERALHRVFETVRLARIAMDEHELVNINEVSDLAGIIADDDHDHR